MDPRERWQALQRDLAEARRLFDAGDYPRALAMIDAALAIDPEFLAAQALRDRLVTECGATAGATPMGPAAPAGGAADAPAIAAGVDLPLAFDIASPAADVPAALPDLPLTPPPVPIPVLAAAPVAAPETAAPPPLVSDAGIARFEERARRRRVDRRADAARVAITSGRLGEAAAAIEEIREIDPNLPELADLVAMYESVSRLTPSHSRAPRWLAAAAMFGTVLLASSWLEQARFGGAGLPAYPIQVGASLPAGAAPVLVTDDGPDASAPAEAAPANIADDARVAEPVVTGPRPVDTMASRQAALGTRGVSLPPPMRPAPIAAEPPAVTGPPVRVTAGADVRPPEAPTRAIDNAPRANETAAPRANEPAARPADEPVRAVDAPAVMPPPVSTPAPRPPADDDRLVRQALQRYREAYEGLDARSAQAVWPAVNERALARAFDDLESQSLRFDRCDVEIRGEAATALCRGTMQYVTKVGSREPRVEPRVWSFSLHKSADEGWTIDTARTER